MPPDWRVEHSDSHSLRPVEDTHGIRVAERPYVPLDDEQTAWSSPLNISGAASHY